MPTTAEVIEASETAKVLQAMLTENTGRHMLDSGGAYGRHWEQNEGEDFGTHPEVKVEWGMYPRPGSTHGNRDREPTLECNVTLDVFQFLKARLEFLPERQAEMDRLAEENPDESWLGLAELWAEEFCEREGEGKPETVNTYNYESHLSQTLQYTFVEDPEDSSCLIVALSIHGGCDVRGGYTAPKMFRVWNWELMDDGKFDVGCSNPDCCDHWNQATRWEYQGGYQPWYTEGDKELTDYPVALYQPDDCPPILRRFFGSDFGLKGVIVVDEKNSRASCPVCGEGELEVYPPFAE